MQKIKDERLQWKNLQNIRVAFAVQTVGIVSILGYDLVTSGMEGMRNNPLWFVFIVTSVVLAYLSINISVDQERTKASPQKSRNRNFGVLFFVAILLSVFTAFLDGSTVISGLIIGLVVLVCGGVPLWYVYLLRKRRQEE
ncbi:hypothetical protein CHL76_14635 [Marinococcus halophilus]|uniref:Uncharacterized protein n=1 Tax=Marinococcus halophilus TaxID=1371 RepID=A0A510Y9Y7_MARHA|nr:hypothetical protein [Marinococcus halophilus]OZT79053.1 hypothetical protein CHL76_14635 [Marinococcus halophilus]GEK59963.1 hypothetical protein MHA01_28680 [Marinococcus halophilus]